jgi:hypothetical protein
MTTQHQATARVIPRVHPEHGPILFINDCPATFGHLVCYQHIGQHGEASLDYYRETKPAREGECDALLREWNGQPPSNVRMVVRQRLDHDLLRAQWRTKR